MLLLIWTFHIWLLAVRSWERISGECITLMAVP